METCIIHYRSFCSFARLRRSVLRVLLWLQRPCAATIRLSGNYTPSKMWKSRNIHLALALCYEGHYEIWLGGKYFLHWRRCTSNIVCNDSPIMSNKSKSKNMLRNLNDQLYASTRFMCTIMTLNASTWSSPAPLGRPIPTKLGQKNRNS